MPTNECIPWFEEADRLPAQATAAVNGKRFVKASAARVSGPMIPATAQIGASDPTDGGRIQMAQTGAGGVALGVSSWDAAIGEGFTCLCVGVVPVVTGASNLAAGVAVQSDANGQAVVWDGTVGSAKLGVTVDSSLAGADAQIKLQVS
jgi:hypothetical protein